MTEPPAGRSGGLELGDWWAELFTADEWRDEVTKGQLTGFAEVPVTQPYVYLIGKPTASSVPIAGEEEGNVGTFVAPCFVAEPGREALVVAILNAIAHETLEWARVDGEPLCDPHSAEGDQMLEAAFSKWLEWKTGKAVILKPRASRPPAPSRPKRRRRGKRRT